MPVAAIRDDSTASLVRRLVRDDGLTRGLGDVEARMLVDWAAGWAERLAAAAPDPPAAAAGVDRVRRRAGAIGRFVRLWGRPRTRAGACQLAAVERFSWPLPAGRVDPADLMHHVLTWERAD